MCVREREEKENMFSCHDMYVAVKRQCVRSCLLPSVFQVIMLDCKFTPLPTETSYQSILFLK